MIYAITAGGLKAIPKTDMLHISPGQRYYYGASASPEPVIVTAATKEWITFTRRPYKKEQRESRQIFNHLAHTGETNQRANLERYAQHYGETLPDWITLQLADIRQHLEHQPGRTFTPEDLQPVEIVIRYDGTGDAWSEWEKHYPHSVSHSQADRYLHSFDFTRADAAKLCAALCAGAYPGFHFERQAETNH